jgi:hypothetical protein
MVNFRVIYHYSPGWTVPFECHSLRLVYLHRYKTGFPVAVASRSKPCTVFASLNAGIAGSNPTQCMDVCVRDYSVCVVMCVGSGLATG